MIRSAAFLSLSGLTRAGPAVLRKHSAPAPKKGVVTASFRLGIPLLLALIAGLSQQSAYSQTSADTIFSGGFEDPCGFPSGPSLSSISLGDGSVGTEIIIEGTQLEAPAYRAFLAGPGPNKPLRLELAIGERRQDRIVASLADPLLLGAYDVVLETCIEEVVLPQAFHTPTFVPAFVEPGSQVVMNGAAFGSDVGTVAVIDAGGPQDTSIVDWRDAKVRFSVGAGHTANGPQDVLITSSNGSLVLTNALVISGVATDDDEGPKLVSAIATSNTSILAQFNEAIIGGPDGAEDATLYRITAPARFPTVNVLSAQVLPPDYNRVRLTTMSQSDLVYTLEVTGIEDLAGNPLAEPDILVDPTRTDFAGIPPDMGQLVDSDGDGLSDAAEQRGWLVAVRRLDGSMSSAHVTSNPGDPRRPPDDPVNMLARDTDGDGLGDFDEKNFGTNPRGGDTDADGLGDNSELNEIYSDPTDQDSDGDSYADGLEFDFFRTSPILADSDGDQLTDDVEIALGNRNPLVADLPSPTLEVGETNLQLDVRFLESTSQSTQVIDSKSVSSSLVQSDSREISNASSQTQEAFAKLAFSNKWEVSVGFKDTGTKTTTQIGAEAGWTGSWTTENTQTSSEQTQRAYEDSLSTEESASEGASVSREVSGASLQASLLLKTTGTLGYRLQNLQVTVLKQDRLNPAALVPIATLLPDSEPPEGYALGPLTQEIGPIILSSQTVFPAQVEDLMRNPRGLIYKISNFDIVDEFGRNFVFTSQDIVERTTNLVIDRGSIDEDGDGVGDLTEYHRVATGSGRVIDTNGDSVIDENDWRVVFDENGMHVGITLATALEAAGYQQYDEDVTPTTSLSEEERARSFSVQSEGPGGTIERIFRIGQTARQAGLPRNWEVITATGVDRTRGFDEYILETGGDLKLAFEEDLDFDRLPSRIEFLNNCSDQCVYSDDPNNVCDAVPGDERLDDRFEVLIGWEIETGTGLRRVFSNCRALDSDGDGLTDAEEAPSELYYVPVDDDPTLDPDRCKGPLPFADSSLCADPPIIARAERDPFNSADGDPNDNRNWPDDIVTDPFNSDTDGDGVSDFDEVRGFPIQLFDTDTVVIFTTNPNRADTDGDGASDGIEREFGGNPRFADADKWTDRDGDGLVTLVEETNRQVQIELASENPIGATAPGTCLSRCERGPSSIFNVQSDPDVVDTDFDGLLDAEERALGTHPGLNAPATPGDPPTPALCTTPPAPPVPCGADTDGDGLTDFQEINGVMVRDELVYTDPLDADSDDDKIPDGREAELDITEPDWWVIRVLGEEAYRVHSHPLIADIDFDTLVDGDEFISGADPNLVNTDGDSRNDAQEVARGTDPAASDYNVQFSFRELNVIEDCDTKNAPTIKNSGDFRINLGVVQPDGTSRPLLVDMSHQFRTPALGPVEACVGLALGSPVDFYPTNRLWQGPCIRQDTGNLMIPDPDQGPPTGTSLTQYSAVVFSSLISFSVNIEQSFRPFGTVNEWDREFDIDWDTTSNPPRPPDDPTDRGGKYPYFLDDPFGTDLKVNGEEVTSKTFFGSDLEPGTYSLVYTKPSPCSIEVKALMIVE